MSKPDKFSKKIQDLTQSANLGSADARYELGEHLYSNSKRQAVEWFEKAAKLGSIKALYQLAHCHANGHGTQKNLPRAGEYLGQCLEKIGPKLTEKFRQVTATESIKDMQDITKLTTRTTQLFEHIYNELNKH